MERWDGVGLALAKEHGQRDGTAGSGLERELVPMSPSPHTFVTNGLLRHWVICHTMEID